MFKSPGIDLAPTVLDGHAPTLQSFGVAGGVLFGRAI